MQSSIFPNFLSLAWQKQYTYCMDIRFREASIKTADNLKTIAQSDLLRDLSRLSLPEIEATTNLVSQVVPAGNVPGVILSGLARLSGHRPPAKTVKRDVDLLFQSVEQMLDKAVYTAIFAGPAAVIWGYQNLLKLAGKDPEASFPDGTWQFYVSYALREDTARHSNETHGFDTLLTRHAIQLNPIDRATAWAMTAIYCLHQFNELLSNEWRERVYLSLLREETANLPEAARFANLYRNWEAQRPYGRGQDAGGNQDYPTYRRARFDRFLNEALQGLPGNTRQAWEVKVKTAEAEELPAYQRQMTILAYLEPGAYGETRVPISLAQTHLGIIYQGRYHFIPICAPGTTQPVDVATVRAQIARLMADAATSPQPGKLTDLALVKRAVQPELRAKLKPALNEELNLLRSAPILLNLDRRSRAMPLSELRQTERGVGDHALTIFDTGETFVFDQSHIFFDGAWGAALAEILTTEALSWAVYLNSLAPAQPAAQKRYLSPGLQFQAAEQTLVSTAPHVTPEVGVESDAINLGVILNLRKFFKQRSETLQLTVNDLLVLYRAIHAITYQPAPELIAILKELTDNSHTRPAAQITLDELLNAKRVSPAILIPIDASQHAPRERLYPMSFEVPLADLDFLQLHAQTLRALEIYEAQGQNVAHFEAFDKLQRTYLAALAGFGAVMSRAKEIATLGESASVGSIKLLAHLPTPLQRLLDNVPGRVDMLNDMMKGREVFSNVGAVAKTSTLTRFITAKDDNDKKTLAWGVITDARGVMRITLRDFRPHVALLQAVGQQEIARSLAQDYLSAYARGLNQYVLELRRMTVTRRPSGAARQENLP